MKGCRDGDVTVAGREGNTSEGSALQQRRDLFTPGHAALTASGRNQMRAGLEEKKNSPAGEANLRTGCCSAEQQHYTLE